MFKLGDEAVPRFPEAAPPGLSGTDQQGPSRIAGKKLSQGSSMSPPYHANGCGGRWRFLDDPGACTTIAHRFVGVINLRGSSFDSIADMVERNGYAWPRTCRFT